MNLDRYEKIDGGFVEAITLMRQGKKVAASNKCEYVIRGDEKIYCLSREFPIESVNSYNDFVNLTWYIPKPFDVRKAMIERPNEWVGAYNDGVGWWAVGFDLDHCCVVSKQIPISYPVDAEYAGTDFPKPEQLNICIPIEDVPEEATR